MALPSLARPSRPSHVRALPLGPCAVDERASKTPEAPAVSFPGSESTYAQLADSTLLAARRLRAAGVGAGDRVAILLREGCEEYVSLGLGAMRLGAVCLPINARNKSHELGYVLQHARPKVLLTAGEFTELVVETGMPEGCRHIVVGADPTFEVLEAPVYVEDVASLEREVDRRTPALLLYTSGTTSNPKGCLLPHAALLAVGSNCLDRLQMTATDRFWTPLAMFHVGGWQSLLSALVTGGCFSHVGVFDADTALEQLERERCTIAFPAFELIWLAVLEHPRFPDADLGALRVVINVGVRARMMRMQELLPNAAQVSCLGMTESTGSICMGAPTDDLESRVTTSGRPLPGMELRVVDALGDDCAPGAQGELLFRGITAFEGYYRDPDRTAETVDQDGWIRTGDLACINPGGEVQFRGRIKDMLKVGGENVSQPRSRTISLTHSAVAAVAVVGAPDARYGEVLRRRSSRRRLGAQGRRKPELIEYCIGRIATFKVPRYVRFVDEYPTTATSKVKKVVLRERIERELRERGVTQAPRLKTGRRPRH